MRYLTQRNRAILREMVVTDFKVRYQGSVLGYLWSLLKPLFMFAILFILFTYIIPIGKEVHHYGVILLTGVVLWNFFSETTTMGAASIVSNGDLLRKINIPRYLIVLASSVSALINLGLNMIVIIVFSVIDGIIPSLGWLMIIPLVLELFILSLGIAFLLSTLCVKFRDITYIWEIILQAGFYASAIIFPITMVPESVRNLFFINPVVQIVQDARHFIIGDNKTMTMWSSITDTWVLILPFVIVVGSIVLGSWYFKRHSPYFAEDI